MTSRTSMICQDVALNLSPFATLRVGLLVGPSGSPEDLIFALGRGRGRDWREDPARGGLEIPAEALPALLRALELLEATRQLKLSLYPRTPEGADR